MTTAKLPVLVVAHTPPPFYGQGIVVRWMLDGTYRQIALHHVRLSFSDSMDEMGRPTVRKALHLLAAIARVWIARIRHRAPVLFYVPAGPSRTTMYRDFAFLIATRWIFARTIFHFHAGGVSSMYPQLSGWERFLFRRAYWRPALGIALSEHCPPDPAELHAEHVAIVPNGLPDDTDGALASCSGRVPVFLYVGAIIESKGLSVLAEAARLLAGRQVEFRLRIAGEVGDRAYFDRLQRQIAAAGVADRVEFLGPLAGSAKWDAFLSADTVVVPSYFESETGSLVAMEAMQVGLPVVATRWRGLPSTVRDGETGYLVPIKDPASLAARMAELAADPELRRRLGRRGREVYLEEFTLERFRQNIEEAVLLASRRTADRSAPQPARASSPSSRRA